MSSINIGKKISELRKSKGMTIKQLSLESKVTSSMLSQLERGLTNPSINMLKTIARTLDVQLFTFFIEEVEKENLVVREADRKKIILPSESNKIITYELLSPDLYGDVELAIMTLTPYSHTSKDNFKHTGEEVAFVQTGIVHLYLNDEKIILSKGDSVKIPPHMLHRWENPYTEITQVIFAVSPPSF